FQAEDGIRDFHVTGVQTCALPITLVLMFAAVAIGFGPVWGSSGWVLPAAGGAVVGLAVAWVGAWRRVPAVTVTALAVVAYLLFGGALALPHTSIGGVVPTLDTLRE